MKIKIFAKIIAVSMSALLAFSPVFAFADGEENAKTEFILTDITDTDTTTLEGEAKILVSVKGADGKLTIAQTAFEFDGGLSYKSVRFLKGRNNPPAGVWYSPDAVSANEQKSFMTSILTPNGIDVNGETELFVLTFSGESGKSVNVKISSLDDTYCVVDGAERFAKDTAEVTAKASSKSNKGTDAKIKLTMDKVSDFSDNDAQISINITSEKTDGYTVYTALNNTAKSKGGHRESESVPTFTVENTLLSGDTYTVEISGIGYVTYKKTGVTFDDVLSVTNAEFIPGDVNADGKADSTDKAEVEKLIENGEYSIAGDFNRDGAVDKYDLAVFDGISDGGKDDGNGDGKDDNTGGSTGGNTGGNTGGSTGGNTGGNGSSGGNGGSSGGSSGGISGGGSKGGSSGGGFGGGVPSVPIASNEQFTDLENYAWAKDAIYTLKNKGIISGVSGTEFAPSNNIRRGDFMLILTRMLGINNEFTDNFADVAKDSYYYNAIGSAKSAGIAKGSGENFMPDNSITRQDLISLAYRAFAEKGFLNESEDLTALDAFADAGEIAEYAKSAMASMVKAGIIKGADGLVNPKGNATRAEVAVMCARMAEMMK